MLTLALVIVVVSLLFYIFRLALNTNKYWERRGIKTLKPIPFVGNTLETVLNKKNIADIYVDLQRAFPNEPITGFYENMSPVLIVQDPEWVEKVLIKDFGHFTDLSVGRSDEIKQPTIDHYQLFTLKGSKWRAFRYKMTPLFTSGKLKHMFECCGVIGDRLIKHIDENPKKDVVIKDVLHLFTLDFVGLSIFGLNAAVLENQNSEYHRMSTNVFDMNYFKMAFMTLFPYLSKKLALSHNNKKAIKYFCKIIEDTFKYRKENNIQRNDFIQMMIQLKEKGKIEIQKWDPTDNYLKGENYIPTESYELTDISLIAQAYTFLTTGLDGVSLTVMYACYELSLHQEIQNKAIEEILRQTKVYSGLTYDALKSMTYLENIISETLRLHPLARALFRACTKEYTFPNGYTMKKGEALHIPQLAIHLNPNNHSDPTEFKPERFDFPMKPGTYLPFGDGPRVCIAMRFALLQIKFGLAKVLSHYRVKLSPKTILPLRIHAQAVPSRPLNPVYFDLEKL